MSSTQPTAKNIRIITLSISIGLLLISLTQKSYCTANGCGDAAAAFIFGAIGFVMGGATITWLANPLLLLSWLTLKKWPRAACGFSLLATCTALSFLFFDTIIADEAGHYEMITGFAAGYWLWVASMVVMFLSSGYRIYFKFKNNTF